MYQAGMDPYERDPVGGIDGVDEEFLRRRDAHVVGAVARAGIPLVVNLAGGYTDTAERLHLMTIREMARDVAFSRRGGRRDRAACRRVDRRCDRRGHARRVTKNDLPCRRAMC